MHIDGRDIQEGSVYFIAEAGVNHDGDPERARELIDIAAESGADAVKFQTFDADRLVSTSADSYDTLSELEFDQDTHTELKRYAERHGITFLSTPFDPQSADLLDDIGVQAIKIGSGELTNHPLLRHVASLGRPLIVSTGMATMEEVLDARAVVEAANPDVDVAFLECTSSYPTPIEHANLRRIGRLSEEGLEPVGFSDHTLSTTVPGFAVAAGAKIVEKHFTLDRGFTGPDHEMSMEPDELAEAVEIAREAAVARGDDQKVPTIDAENREEFRKGVHADVQLTAGDRITSEDICLLRPGTGITPDRVEDVVGARAERDIAAGETITDEMISS